LNLDDAAGVIQVQSDSLDWPYLKRWASALGISDLLTRARRGEPFAS
jgi:DNA polymerase elongation subunit (family B)